MSYVYAVARLRGMENRLLDASFLSRLMESPTLDDALKALAETSYAQWFGKVAETGFDRAIDDEMLATCRELGQFVPDTDLITLFRMPYDYHNVKVILKSLFKVRGGDPEGRRHELLSPLGSLDPEELTAALEAEEYAHLPYGLGYLIPQCWLHWDQTKDAQGVELLLDHHLFASMLALAESLKLPEIAGWVRHKIDAENLRSAVRLQRMGVDAAGGLPFFHPGGNIRPEDAARLLGEPPETWGKLLSHTDIGAALDVLQERTDLRATLSDVSRALDEYLIRVLERARFSMDDPANVLLYLLTKEAEARNLRIVLVCVASGLDREFARRLLSHVR